ncbi:CPBP family intramembrane metalloprotease [Stieleria sp. ICT_E10.1]|uniref:CPBP family intramembrane metalloprotease n=1 Tax=Stieleria sedimenti TaxID=2976331 RepID=UPI00217F46E0|nr:CPBP family intramembrane metalloprotease [Stieleria sedimenti]MCS7467969.1 CPBP family intramembrane metalloprotease [Stieleria sedimenti]
MQRVNLFEIGFIAISLTVLALLVAGGVLWIQWWRGRGQRNLCGDVSPDLITRLPQPRPRWTVFDFLLMFGMMILVGASLQQSLPTPQQETDETPTAAEVVEQAVDATPEEASAEEASTKDPSDRAAKLRSQVRIHFIANLVAFVLTLLFLRLTQGATLAHLSLVPNRDDVRRGLFATVWILAPVLLLNLLVSNLVQYEHTVTNLLAEESGTRTFLALLVSAACLTPIVEEFQFRLLLQGGLQQIADPPPDSDAMSFWKPSTAWPIYVTSLLFAAMHWGQGAAPIPLFFLSVGLGFLYQRTGRLVPAIVVHMLLNAATLCMEFCRVNAGL